MWSIVELMVILWTDFQEMLFITEFKGVCLYLCAPIFLETQFDLHFMTKLSFKQNTLTWALPTWINCQVVTLILKEQTKIGTTSGMLITGSHMVKTNLELQSRFVLAEEKLMLFNSISRNWILTYPECCKNY